MSTVSNPPKFIRLPEVVERVGFSRPTIWRYIKNGIFPQPVKIGSHAVAWVEHEIDDWMAQRIEASRPINQAAKV